MNSYVLFQDTLYKCTAAVTTGESFDPTKWLAIKATDEIAAGGYTLPTASASTLGGVKVGSGLAIDASGVLSASGGSWNHTKYSSGTNDKVFVLSSNTATGTAYSLTSTNTQTLNANLTDCSGDIEIFENGSIAILVIKAIIYYDAITLNETSQIHLTGSVSLNTNYTNYNNLYNFLQTLSTTNKMLLSKAGWGNVAVNQLMQISGNSGPFSITFDDIIPKSNNTGYTTRYYGHGVYMFAIDGANA